MSAEGVRDPKFTTRLERALLQLARRKRGVGTAAHIGGVSQRDLVLWLNEFNNGRSELTEARIEQVKREVGVLVTIRAADLPPAEAAPATPAMRLPASLGGELPIRATGGNATAVADAVQQAPDVPGSGQEAVRRWERRKRELRARGGAVAAPVELAWRTMLPHWQRRAARKWRNVLEYVVEHPGADARELLARLDEKAGQTAGAWGQFRMNCFGGMKGLTPAAAREFLLATLGAAPAIGPEPEVAAPVAEVPAEPEKPAFVLRELDAVVDRSHFTQLLVVAGDDGTVVGTVTLRWKRREIPDFHRLFVAEEWRRRGVARALIGRCIEIALRNGKPALSCTVQANNEPARALYGAMGFKAGFQFDDGDLLMSLALPVPAGEAEEGRAA